MPPADKARIDHASAATAASERAIESVRNLMKRPRPINGDGVYMDRNGVNADLAAALRDLEAAWTALNTYPWPTPADYSEA